MRIFNNGIQAYFMVRSGAQSTRLKTGKSLFWVAKLNLLVPSTKQLHSFNDAGSKSAELSTFPSGNTTESAERIQKDSQTTHCYFKVQPWGRTDTWTFFEFILPSYSPALGFADIICNIIMLLWHCSAGKTPSGAHFCKKAWQMTVWVAVIVALKFFFSEGHEEQLIMTNNGFLRFSSSS